MSTKINPRLKKINDVKRVVYTENVIEETYETGVDESMFTGAISILNNINFDPEQSRPRIASIIKFNGDGSANLELSFFGAKWFKVPNNAFLSDIFGEDVLYAGELLVRKENPEDPNTEIYVATVSTS